MEQSKTDKQFNEHLQKLVALFGGDKAFQKQKLPNEQVSLLVDELIKEKREEALVSFKTKAKELLDKKIEFDREVKKLEKELADKITQKKEEFINKMKELFAIVDNIDQIASSYYDSINNVSSNE